MRTMCTIKATCHDALPSIIGAAAPPDNSTPSDQVRDIMVVKNIAGKALSEKIINNKTKYNVIALNENKYKNIFFK